MHHLHHLLHAFHHFKFLAALALLASTVPAVMLGVVIVRRYRAARRHRPTIAKADVLYRESFASGASQKNVLTQIGGANNCLRLVVTREILWVTSWFPFSVIAAFYDLEHVIPLRSILALDGLPGPSSSGLLLAYADSHGAKHALKLYPKDRAAFLRALALPPSLPVTNVMT